MWHWWFRGFFHQSLRVYSSDFAQLKIPMQDDLQKDISSFETLAQIALVFIVIRHLPSCRMTLRISTLSENTAAESQTLQRSNATGIVFGKTFNPDFIFNGRS